MKWMVFVALVACSKSAAPPAKPAEPKPAPKSTWATPAGWRGETIPFPLDFAKSIQHTGEEELRFPKGMFDPASGEYWSYAFTWRTQDAAELDANALAAELTTYFKGLIAAVDEKKKIAHPEEIVVQAKGNGHFELTAHVFDAFKTALPVDLVGWAERTPCESGALWVVVLAPEKTSIRAELDTLAKSAKCY
jgi:hypothetical protein